MPGSTLTGISSTNTSIFSGALAGVWATTALVRTARLAIWCVGEPRAPSAFTSGARIIFSATNQSGQQHKLYWQLHKLQAGQADTFAYLSITAPRCNYIPPGGACQLHLVAPCWQCATYRNAGKYLAAPQIIFNAVHTTFFIAFDSRTVTVHRAANCFVDSFA